MPVDLTAAVEDQETAVDGLTYEWSADGGSFTGTGTKVKWQPPTGMPTPQNYSLRVTVVEPYQALNGAGQIVTQTHRVVSEVVIVRVHDSPKELGDMGLRFLGFFANSSLSPQACLVDFSDNCGGKADEFGDIVFNRAHYLILSSTLGPPRVNYTPGSNSADMLIRTAITSRIINCQDMPAGCVVGSLENALFDGFLRAVYENGRWWLCVSNARALTSLTPSMRFFFGPSS
jgi:hypothetical protein